MSSRALKTLIAVGLGLALAGVAAIWRAIGSGPAPAGELKTVTEYRDDKPLPAFRLSGPRGEFTEASLRGRWHFVFFGYTQCPDICPTALGLMKELQAAVPPVTEGNPGGTPAFGVVFVSVDPARDTHALLHDYLAAFDPAFIGITGSDGELAPLTRDLGVFYQRNDATDKKHYTVDHSATIYLIDPQGRLAATFSPPQVASRMVADYKRITASR